MKKTLILQMRPEDETANSEFRAILNKGNLKADQVERVRVEQLLVKEVDLHKYNAIVAGGSPFDLSTPVEEKTETQKKIEDFFYRLFDQLIPRDFPFLGACSGNGLLGSYLGTNISGKYTEPVGHVQVKLTDEGKKDSLLKDFPNTFTAMVGHKEACDTTPEGATLLVTSEPCPVQMFRVKENIYATQFHPEADEAEFILRINIYKNYGYFAPEDAEKLKKNVEGIQPRETNEILRRFIEKYT